MPFNRYVIMIVFILYLQIILPVDIISNAFSAQPDYLITLIHVLSGMLFLFYALPWEYTNYYIRYIYLGFLLLGISISSWGLVTSEEFFHMKLQWIVSRKSTVLWTMAFLYILFNIMRARMKQKDSIDLQFPFKDGHYLITEGGDGKKSFLTNYHYKHWKTGYDRFATDIVKLDSRGFSNKGIVPVDNNLFYIYDEPLYSPIEGEVFLVIDEYEEHSAHSGKYPPGVGNMVVIKKDDYYVLLGHLKKGKTVVAEGQRIKAGELVGSIGMTGYTPRPHLHMNVSQSETGDYWKGKGIPITFDGKPANKNNLFKV